MLVKFYKRLDAIKGTLVIVRASPAVRTVLDMTRLTALLVDQSPPSDPATLTVGTTMVRDGMVCELFDLQRAARLRLSAIGGEHAIGSPADRAVASQVLRCPPSTTAIGVGAFGAEPRLPRIGSASSSRSRARPCACPPTERKWPTTWSPRARRRRSCTSRAVWSAMGAFARHLRFEPTEPRQHITLSTLAALCLELADADAVGVGRHGRDRRASSAPRSADRRS